MPVAQDFALEAQNLHLWRGQQQVIRGFCLQVLRGQIIGLLGLNGAGKSTTLQLLAGVLSPDLGDVRVGGVDLATKPLEAKRLIGYLPQTIPALSDETVSSYLDYHLRLYRIARAKRQQQLERAIERCQLGEFRHKRLSTLSRGTLQRVGIASAGAHEPALLLLDEPSAGLDPAQRVELTELIRSLGGEVSVVLSTHLIADVERACDRVSIIHQGSCAANLQIETTNAPGLDRIELGLHNAPPLEQLQSNCRATQARRREDGLFELSIEPSMTSAEDIAAIATAQGWRLFHIRGIGNSPAEALEATFLSVTQQIAPESPC